MLGELEDKVLARLGELKEQLSRLTLDSYGGELGDPDLVSQLLRRCPAVLITTPRARFARRSNRRYGLDITFRLVMASRHPRDERATRRGTGRPEESGRGTTADPGSYALWEACVRKLTDWQPWPERPGCQPTEFANLVNGRFQSDHLSVLGQSFTLAALWDIQEEELPLLAGIDMSYSLPTDPDTPVPSGTLNFDEQET